MKITVLLADDHTVVREGLKLLLNSADDVEGIMYKNFVEFFRRAWSKK